MFFMRRPSSAVIERFIDRSRETPLAYGTVGRVGADTAGANVDDMTTVIGRGPADFERARGALAAWRQFEMDWLQLLPPGASLQPGTTVVLRVHHLGFWSLNGARVVYGVGDRHHGDRYGTAYATLTNHAERGEELFEVSFDPDTDEVEYHIRAVSWPQATLARIGYPITRWLQARFRRDSTAAMLRATRGRESPS